MSRECIFVNNLEDLASIAWHRAVIRKQQITVRCPNPVNFIPFMLKEVLDLDELSKLSFSEFESLFTDAEQLRNSHMLLEKSDTYSYYIRKTSLMEKFSIDTVIDEIWEQQVLPFYKQGKIQGERHLQTYLFMWLKEKLSEDSSSDWEVWVEPEFDFSDGNTKKTYKPDIVITKDYEIACFIELKFTPQDSIKSSIERSVRDFDKLEKYLKFKSAFPENQNGNCFFLELDPRKGSYHEPIYQRTADTLYAFLAIGRYAQIAENLKDKLAQKCLNTYIRLIDVNQIQAD